MSGAAQLSQPVPFEIIEDGAQRVASNGQLVLTVLDEGGRIFRRRGVTGIGSKPAAEVLIPQLNRLAGELLQNPGTPAQEAVASLLAIAGLVPVAEPKRVEWAVAELNGVRVYTDGRNVVITTKDLVP